MPEPLADLRTIAADLRAVVETSLLPDGVRLLHDADVVDLMEAAASIVRSAEALLVEQGAITPDQLSRAMAERYGLDHVDLSVYQVDVAAAALFPVTGCGELATAVILDGKPVRATPALLWAAVLVLVALLAATGVVRCTGSSPQRRCGRCGRCVRCVRCLRCGRLAHRRGWPDAA